MDLSMAEIPPGICERIIPSNDISISDFLSFPLPPESATTNPHTMETLSTSLSPLIPTVTDAAYIQGIHTPSIKSLDKIHKSPELAQAQSIICEDSTGASIHVPLWVLSYWTRISKIRPFQHLWITTKEKHDRLLTRPATFTDNTATLSNDVLLALSSLSWYGNIRGFPISVPIENLAPYLTEEWFSDEQENQMLHLLRHELEEGESSSIDVVDTYFFQLLASAYNDGTYDTSKSTRWLRQKGQQLANGEYDKLITIVNINDNHWVAVVLDLKLSKILYGDSMGGTINEKLEALLTWWTHYHTGQAFSTSYLPITRQRDSHSCGLLAVRFSDKGLEMITSH